MAKIKKTNEHSDKMAVRQEEGHSRELRLFYAKHFELWRRKHRGTQEELAQQCGVTSSYLSQVGRYGRIPGKPVLILLALLFELEDPEEIFRAAHIQESWPIDTRFKLTEPLSETKGFLSVKLDMDGFTSTMRELIRAEVRPKNVRDLTRGNPLRVGCNLYQSWFFQETAASIAMEEIEQKLPGRGLVGDFLRLAEATLNCQMSYSSPFFRKAFELLPTQLLDVYGPVLITPDRFEFCTFTDPICEVSMSALWRKTIAPGLSLPTPPRSIAELVDGEYRVAVFRGSASHNFAMSSLGLKESQLILCDEPEEGLERVLLAKIPRPAHMLICDSLSAIRMHAEHPRHTDLLFADGKNSLGWVANGFAVRSDWPELVELLNSAIQYAQRSGLLERLFDMRLNVQTKKVMRFTREAV